VRAKERLRHRREFCFCAGRRGASEREMSP
jgi:hypothetical protein